MHSHALACSAGGEPLQVGSRTECALLALAAGLGEDYAAARERHRQAAVAPFSSERKRMSTLAVTADPRWVVTKPSWHGPFRHVPEVLLRHLSAHGVCWLCTRI